MNGIRISNSAWGGPSMQFRDVTFSSCTFIGVSMKNSELIGLNFSSLNFENANLTNASLKVVNFSKANLRGAILIGIHSQYSETTLDKVMNFLAYRSCTLNLNYANLKNANLSNAVLIGATLKNTILVGADLRGANLSHADLSNAIIDKTTKLDGTILTNAKINWLYYEQLSKAEQNKINDINNYWTRKLNKQHNNSHSFAISLTHAPSNEQRASVSLPLTQHQSLSVTGLFASSSQDSSPSHTPVEAALSIQNDNLPHIYTNEIKISHPYFKVTRVNSTNRSLYQFDMRGLASVLDSEQQFRLQEAIRSETIWPYQQGFIESDRYFRELNLGDIRAAQYLLQILGDLLNLPADNLQLLDDVATEDTAYQSKAAMSYSPPSIALSDIPSARPKSPEQQLSHNSSGLLYHNELTAEPLSHQQLSTNTSDSDSDEVESTKNNSDADNLRFH